MRPGIVDDIWEDIQVVFRSRDPKSGYPTQKPEALLERIIQASSEEGDIVLDCFCGSGTTAAVAEKLHRRWIACDIGRFAIHTTRNRLLRHKHLHPFLIQNIAKYERQAWQIAVTNRGQLNEVAAAQQQYRHFILSLYHAHVLNGYSWLHGKRGKHLIHVGNIDAPIAQGDIFAIVQEAQQMSNSHEKQRVDILGWDFAFEVNEMMKQWSSNEANVALNFKYIPRDILDAKTKTYTDVQFFELAALKVHISIEIGNGSSTRERKITVALEDFMPPHEIVLEDIQGMIQHWSQWIDYWAVDWNYAGIFHNMTQIYRTLKDFNLHTSVEHVYRRPGSYTIAVKVIDIFGNDTTKKLFVELD